MLDIAIVGGHGKVRLETGWFLGYNADGLKIGMRLTRLLIARGDSRVVSIFRNGWHAQDVATTGATAVVICLEHDTAEKLAAVFEGKDIVYFCAGAEGKGGPQRYRKVDYEGALKVFDAIELVREPRPRLIMVSALDVRDRSVRPAHYVRVPWVYAREPPS